VAVDGCVEVARPACAAELAVRQHLQADGSLQVERVQDCLILDRPQLVNRDLVLGIIRVGLQHLGRTQQAPDVVGTIDNSHGRSPASEVASAARTFPAALTIASSLPKAAARGRYFMPQSGASTSRSGGTCSSAARMRPSTVSTLSTSDVPRSST